MVTYTLAGALTSVLLGAGLGLVGALALPDDMAVPAGLLGLAVATVAVARELGVVAIPLPQLGRQTQGMWAKSYGFTAAALLWGLDLGLVFTTWLTLSGAWVLALAAFLVGKPLFGAALFGAYWLGRALSVWVGPLLMERATDTPRLLATLYERRRLFRSAHVVGLACTMLVFGSWILSGTTM